MARASLLLLLAALAPTSAVADECRPIERTAGPPVYAILYGYPYGPQEGSPLGVDLLPDLAMVDDDLLHMARLFEALGPAQMYVHGEPSPKLLGRLSAFGVRAPTWRSLRQSVAELAAAIDRHAAKQTPRVYIYLAGHGIRVQAEAGARLTFFGRPEGKGPGYSGVIDSALFARHVLAPLAARADVHLIADTCFSYTLLQTRAMKRIERIEAPLPPEAYEEAFGEAFPEIGAHLASRSTTPEDGERGGYFSHALRAAAIGVADVDHDDVVTYGEMRSALRRLADDDPLLGSAIVVAPGLDDDAAFIRWDQSPATRVCAAPGPAGVLRDHGTTFTTLPQRASSTPLWLPPGRFTLDGTPLTPIADDR